MFFSEAFSFPGFLFSFFFFCVFNHSFIVLLICSFKALFNVSTKLLGRGERRELTFCPFREDPVQWDPSPPPGLLVIKVTTECNSFYSPCTETLRIHILPDFHFRSHYCTSFQLLPSNKQLKSQYTVLLEYM